MSGVMKAVGFGISGLMPDVNPTGGINGFDSREGIGAVGSTCTGGIVELLGAG